MKLSLAPIQGMTIAYYRNLYAELFGGIDEYYSPFIATTGVRKNSLTLFKDLFAEHNNEDLHLIPQLLGNNSDDFKYFAKRIVDLGYKEINWNIGCPYPTVTKKKKGSGILQYPDIIKTFLDDVCQDLDYDLTVKMRLGMHSLEEGSTVMELLNEYPIKKVILHGRTGDQKYNGHVNLDAFDDLYQLCNHPLVYNGDIFTKEDYERIANRFPTIDEFMLGRGAIRDPLLASKIKGAVYTHREEIDHLHDFHSRVLDFYKGYLSGDKHILDKMKEFWYYLGPELDEDGKLLKKIKKATTCQSYEQHVEKLFEQA